MYIYIYIHTYTCIILQYIISHYIISYYIILHNAVLYATRETAAQARAGTALREPATSARRRSGLIHVHM